MRYIEPWPFFTTGRPWRARIIRAKVGAEADGTHGMIAIDYLDHLVLTVADIGTTAAWYRDVLGMRVETFGEGRTALLFGGEKINLHEAGKTFEPKAARPTPGSADLCFVTSTPIEAVRVHLAAHNVAVEEGPVRRTGATGPILSVYVRDPDLNLIEISNLV